MPPGIDFEYIKDKVTVQFQDIKPGSATYGQTRTVEVQGLKPENHGIEQAQAPDIIFPHKADGTPVAVSKAFKGWGAIWMMYKAKFKTVVGGKYKLTWPVFPDLVMTYKPVKTAADDPSAGWMRLRVKSGDLGLHIDPVNGGPDTSWLNGRKFAFCDWYANQVVIDALDPVVTVGLEMLSPFGLEEDGWFIAPPILEVISLPSATTGGTASAPAVNPPPVTGAAAGTLRAALQALSDDAAAAGRIGTDVQNVLSIIG